MIISGGTVAYVWPEWLCRFLTEWSDGWNRERGFDVGVIERLRREVGLGVDCICDVCSRGWMQRLDEKVSPFLKSMIAGEPTPLPPARQKLLARWAAKTAAVMERVSDRPIRTPRFGCEHLRRIGVHPGTQVLVGRYHGDLQVFTHERDLFSRTIEGETHYLSQSTFVMGNLLIQVFTDPWRDSRARARRRRAASSSSHSFPLEIRPCTGHRSSRSTTPTTTWSGTVRR